MISICLVFIHQKVSTIPCIIQTIQSHSNNILSKDITVNLTESLLLNAPQSTPTELECSRKQPHNFFTTSKRFEVLGIGSLLQLWGSWVITDVVPLPYTSMACDLLCVMRKKRRVSENLRKRWEPLGCTITNSFACHYIGIILCCVVRMLNRHVSSETELNNGVRIGR